MSAPEPAPFQWRYWAEVASAEDVYDADTVTMRVDLGFHISAEIRVRLYGIDAWEMRGAERAKGTEARDWLRQRIVGKRIEIETFRDMTGKFGRWLVTIWLNSGSGRVNVNDELIALGFAERNYYGAPPD